VTSARRYDVLRTPHVARVVVCSLVARLPNATTTLALLLLLAPRHGYAVAGLCCTLFVAGSGFTGPLLARAVDRRGARRVAGTAAGVQAAALLAVASLADRPLGLLIVIVAVAGLTQPPTTAVVRGLWPRLLPADRLPALYGLEATAQELVYIAGPALLGLIVALSGARAATVLVGVVEVAGMAALLTTPVFAHDAHAARAAVPLRPSRRLLAWLLLAAGLTGSFGVTEVAVVAFVSPHHRGTPAAAGVVLAVWSLGSLLSGAVFGRRQGRVTDRSVVGGTVLVAALTALPAVAVGRVALGALLFLAGWAIAPALARLYLRTSAAAPAGAQTEVFGWLGVAFTVGNAAGDAIGGVASSGLGARPALLLAAVPPLVASGAALLLLRGGGSAAGGEGGPGGGEAGMQRQGADLVDPHPADADALLVAGDGVERAGE
jgi:predicted MFS family arabinose efflux permease